MLGQHDISHTFNKTKGMIGNAYAQTKHALHRAYVTSKPIIKSIMELLSVTMCINMSSILSLTRMRETMLIRSNILIVALIEQLLTTITAQQWS